MVLGVVGDFGGVVSSPGSSIPGNDAGMHRVPTLRATATAVLLHLAGYVDVTVRSPNFASLPGFVPL